MGCLRKPRMQVQRYADITQHTPERETSRGLGLNVIGLHYGRFAKVVAAGHLTGTAVSESLDREVRRRLDPPSILELDASVIAGRSVADRAITWLESGKFAEDHALKVLQPWVDHVLRLARAVRDDDDVQLVMEMGERILREVGWPEGRFAQVCDDGLRALYDDDSPTLGPLLEAMLATGTGRGSVDLGRVTESVRSLVFDTFEDGYDFRLLKEETA
jgi:hypothetical protein